MDSDHTKGLPMIVLTGDQACDFQQLQQAFDTFLTLTHGTEAGFCRKTRLCSRNTIRSFRHNDESTFLVGALPFLAAIGYAAIIPAQDAEYEYLQRPVILRREKEIADPWSCPLVLDVIDTLFRHDWELIGLTVRPATVAHPAYALICCRRLFTGLDAYHRPDETALSNEINTEAEALEALR